MPRPWSLVDAVDSHEGRLELRRRGDSEWMISIAGRVLMSSRIHRSELAVAELACAQFAAASTARVLIGGLGLGYTLRAALDALPRKAEVTVAELNGAVVGWCQGPAASLTGGAAADRRVRMVVGDVMDCVRRTSARKPYDAIILDLYAGPADTPASDRDPLYGRTAVQAMHAALEVGGVVSVWAEEPSPRYVRRLEAAGFSVELKRVRGGGPQHTVYLATKRKLSTKRRPASKRGPASKGRPAAVRKPKKR